MKELPEDKRKKALKVFQPNGSGKLLAQLNSCVRCGLCAESCIYYLADGDERCIPARKVDAVASIYRRYFTRTGRTFPWLTGAKSLTQEHVNEMKDLLYGSCTVCGRCVPNCSIGLDIAYLVQKGREMLSRMGEVPESLQHSLDIALDTGNNMGIAREDFIETLKWLEEDLRLEVNDEKATIPFDEPGTKILYTLNPREPKFFPLSISAMAKIFYAAGESWTLSSRMYDVTNYGYFTGDEEYARQIAEKMYEEICRLEVGTFVLAECGHGSRAFRWEAPNYLERKFCFDVLTSVELIAGYIRQGRIRLDPSKIREKVTLHDPCNLVRNGGVIEEQRYILRHAVSDFVEMTPHGTDNYCCGGGGGQLAMGEYNERRLRVASIKAEQIRRTGAKIVCSPCHNCIDQLTQTSQVYHLGVKVVTLAELVADALILDTPTPEHLNTRTPEHLNTRTQQPMEFIYLDNSATAFPKPEEVYNFMDRFYRENGVNPGRSGFDAAIATGELVYETRKLLTRLFNGDDPNRLTFSYNASDSLNMVIQGLAEPGDHVVTTMLEHNSVLRPLYHLECNGVIRVTHVPFDEKGFVHPEEIRRAIRSNTKMVIVNHSSNVIGTIQPIAEIGRICKEMGVYFIVDGSQSAGAIPIDLKAMGVDIFVFTGHKCLMGPTGIGGSYVMDDIPVRQTRFGGTGVRSAQKTHLEEYPYRLECGTLNISGIAGLYAGVKWLLEKDIEMLHQQEMALWDKLRKGLRDVKNVILYGPDGMENQNPVVSFNIEGFESGDVGTMLDVDYNIACRTGLHCAPMVHQVLGTDKIHGSVRFSLGPFNTESHVDHAIRAVAEIATLQK